MASCLTRGKKQVVRFGPPHTKIPVYAPELRRRGRLIKDVDANVRLIRTQNVAAVGGRV